MIFAGIVWRSNKKKLDLAHGLKSKINRLVEKTSTIEDDLLTFFSGTLNEKNDNDSTLYVDNAVFVGRAFAKDTYKSLTSEEFKEISFDHDTNNLIQKYWGKYVSIVNDLSKDFSTVKITRDPTGQLPFFYSVDNESNIVFSSEIQIIVDYTTKEPEYNSHYLSNYIINGASYSNHTLFKNVYELPPGHTLTIKPASLTIEEAWNPITYYTHNYQPNDLFTSGKNVLKSWINDYENIFLSLSGGLDSTALLCFLNDIKRPTQNLIAINYFHSKTKTTNELKYASDICSKLNIDLRGVDFLESLPFDDLSYPFSICPNRPLPAIINFNQHKMISDIIHTDKSSVFISGHGGDHLFMCPPLESSLSDYVFEKGFKEFRHKLEDLASYYRKPITSILKNNVRDVLLSLKNKNAPPSFENPGWIKADLIEKALSCSENKVYSQFSKTRLPGKRQQLESIKSAFPTISLEYIDPSNPTFYPFLYQPIIELVLAIPTYDLYQEGYDRYPLRKCITDYYKIDMVWRREKGQTTGMFQLGIKKNMENIMGLCSEGHFCRNGLIDKENLFKHIREVSCGSTRALWPLINLISAEIFVSSWRSYLNK